MKRAKALMTGLLVAAAFLACDNGPVDPNDAPRVTIEAESVAVNLFTSASVMAAVFNVTEAPQYVSHDQNVATVNASGGITGVGVGSTSSLRSRATLTCVTPFAFACTAIPVEVHVPISAGWPPRKTASSSAMTSMRR